MSNTAAAKKTTWQVWVILISMCFAVFTVATTNTSVMNIMVVIRNQFDLNPSTLLWIVNAYMLGTVSLVIVSGAVSDIVGRRNMFAYGVLIFIIGTIVVALSFDGTWLILGRAIQGIGAAVITPTTLAIVKTRFSPEKQAAAVGTWTAAIGLGFAVGPILGGAFANTIGWRYLFWLLAILMLASLLLMLIARPKNIKVAKDKYIDIGGLILYLLFIIPFVLGLSNGNTWQWNNPWTIGLMAWGACFLVILYFFERKKARPLVHFDFFKTRGFLIASVAIFVTIFLLIDVLYFFNLYFQDPILIGYTALQSGLALLPFSVGFFVTSLMVSRIVGWLGHRIPITIGFLLMAGGFLWFCFISLSTTYLFLWAPILMLGIGIGFNMSVLAGVGMQALDDKLASPASSLLNVSIYFGGICGAAIGSIFLLEIGSHSFIKHFDLFKVNITEGLRENSLLGHPQSIQNIIHHTSAHAGVHQFLQAIQYSSFSGIIAVYILCASLALTAAIFAALLLRK